MSIGPHRAFISAHARRRCCQMGLERGEVVATLENPEVTYPSDPRYGTGRCVSVAGRLAVVHTDDWVVVTVLWNGRTGRDEGPLFAA